jgi:hypothetical protein
MILMQSPLLFAFPDGAALCYASVNQSKNTQLLSKYVISRLYSTNFKETAQVVARETVFVPAGWDSLPKINLLNDNAPLKEDDDEKALFLQLIHKPPVQKVSFSFFGFWFLVVCLLEFNFVVASF